jgi:hypothetical protein
VFDWNSFTQDEMIKNILWYGSAILIGAAIGYVIGVGALATRFTW